MERQRSSHIRKIHKSNCLRDWEGGSCSDILVVDDAGEQQFGTLCLPGVGFSLGVLFEGHFASVYARIVVMRGSFV